MQRAEIRIEGRLDAEWAEWFKDLTLTYTDTGETILAGCVPDQAALYGLMAKLRDLGVKLLSVNLDPPSGKNPPEEEQGFRKR